MNVVLKVDEKTKQEMIEYYKDKLRDKTPPYAIFQAKDEDTIITLYQSGKVMFQGNSADVDASKWGIDIQDKQADKKTQELIDLYKNTNSIGSDEVGTGDYFGPVVVTSSYVSKDDIEFLKELGVRDSKKLTDDVIKAIAPKIIKKIKYESIILNPEEYNKYYNSYDFNFNKIKAILHNKVLFKLVNEIKKENLPIDYIIVDEFAREKSYYNYISDATDIQKDITFIAHAEDISYPVAVSSIISRFIFLQEMEKLRDKFHSTLPLGAGVNVDEAGKELVEKEDSLEKRNELLKKVAKYNFANTQRILGTKIM